MSVIVGVQYKNKVYLGCDTESTLGLTKNMDASRPMIFRKGDMLIGAAGLVRIAQVLQFGYTLPKRFENEDDTTYMYRWCTVLKKFLKSEDELSEGSYMNTVLLLGYKNVLYSIDPYFSFSTHDKHAVGLGADLAISSLDESKGTPKQKIIKAIKAIDADNDKMGFSPDNEITDSKILIQSI